MKALPLRKEGSDYLPCEPEAATFLKFNLPGPISTRVLPVQIKGKREGTGNWTWNGDTEKPTLRPSILNDFRPHSPLVCHTWITDGQVIFLTDSTHELSGQTLDLLEIEQPTRARDEDSTTKDH